MRMRPALPKSDGARAADTQGTVIMLTFGTGIGTALFVDGKLLPNTEFGHMEVQGMEAEKWTSAHVRTAAEARLARRGSSA